MKTTLSLLVLALLLAGCSTLGTGMSSAGLTSATGKALQALTLSDVQIMQATGEFIAQSDAQNRVAGPNDPYAIRLSRLTAGIPASDGLNFKVYLTEEVNAFACADGSVRVYSGLMDIMSDEEVLGVIGHEIGHVMNRDTKDAFRNALMVSAARDAIGSTSGGIAALTSSQLGDLGEAFLSSNYSKRQELEADSFGYEFLKARGVNPWAMALSFRKLESLQQGAPQTGAIQQLFSTHPDIAARTRIMTERATQDGFPRPGASTSSAPATAPKATTNSQWSF